MRAIFALSADPITLGHLDLITRSCALFETVFVVLATNPKKTSMFTEDQKYEMVEEACKELKNTIIVTHTHGALIDFCKNTQVNVVVRGLRSVTDFDYEMALAQTNKLLGPNIETFFMSTRPEHAYISSSIVRELISLKKYDMLRNYVPWPVERFVRNNVK